jgi:hypothetical protein
MLSIKFFGNALDNHDMSMDGGLTRQEDFESGRIVPCSRTIRNSSSMTGGVAIGPGTICLQFLISWQILCAFYKYSFLDL